MIFRLSNSFCLIRNSANLIRSQSQSAIPELECWSQFNKAERIIIIFWRFCLCRVHRSVEAYCNGTNFSTELDEAHNGGVVIVRPQASSSNFDLCWLAGWQQNILIQSQFWNMMNCYLHALSISELCSGFQQTQITYALTLRPSLSCIERLS